MPMHLTCPEDHFRYRGHSLRGTFPDKVVHGGEVRRFEEQNGRKVLDFSASLNPVPPPVCWDTDPACLLHYPDNGYTRLKEVIAETFHRDPGGDYCR